MRKFPCFYSFAICVKVWFLTKLGKEEAPWQIELFSWVPIYAMMEERKDWRKNKSYLSKIHNKNFAIPTSLKLIWLNLFFDCDTHPLYWNPCCALYCAPRGPIKKLVVKKRKARLRHCIYKSNLHPLAKGKKAEYRHPINFFPVRFLVSIV